MKQKEAALREKEELERGLQKKRKKQKREKFLNEEKIAVLTQQHEEVTGLLKHKTEEYEELQSGYICDINFLIDTVPNNILFAYDVYVCVIFSHV